MFFNKNPENRRRGMDNGAIYGLGVIGAAFYFLKTATSFGMGIIGVIKALFWPAVVLYKVLEYLKM